MSYPVGVSAGIRPRRGIATSRETAGREPADVSYVTVRPAHRVVRPAPVGRPPDHLAWKDLTTHTFPEAFVLRIRQGMSVGQHSAVVTPSRTLDFQTSRYFAAETWRQHPVFISPRPTRVHRVAGRYALLSSAGTAANYYHFLMEAVPRLGHFAQALGAIDFDGYVADLTARYHREVFAMLGVDASMIRPPAKGWAIQPDELWVASSENRGNTAPPETTAWLRANLRPTRAGHLPKRIYVTRGQVPKTRRMVNEPELVASLARHGFSVIDPGGLSVQEQINHFASAEIVVAPHGAGLTNLNFSPPGVKVLELFPPTYVDTGMWSIASNIPDSTYRYLLGRGESRYPRSWRYQPWADVDCAVSDVMDALSELT